MSEAQDNNGGDGDTISPPLPARRVPVDVELFNRHIESLAVSDNVDVQEKVLRQVLAATTAADILRAGEAVPADTLCDVPLRILGIRASESGFVDGADYYLHVDAEIVSNGDPVTFSCGASDVAMKLIRMDQLGLFPTVVRLEKAKKATQAGFFPMFLRPVNDDGEPF